MAEQQRLDEHHHNDSETIDELHCRGGGGRVATEYASMIWFRGPAAALPLHATATPGRSAPMAASTDPGATSWQAPAVAIEHARRAAARPRKVLHAAMRGGHGSLSGHAALQRAPRPTTSLHPSTHLGCRASRPTSRLDRPRCSGTSGRCTFWSSASAAAAASAASAAARARMLSAVRLPAEDDSLLPPSASRSAAARAARRCSRCLWRRCSRRRRHCWRAPASAAAATSVRARKARAIEETTNKRRSAGTGSTGRVCSQRLKTPKSATRSWASTAARSHPMRADGVMAVQAVQAGGLRAAAAGERHCAFRSLQPNSTSPELPHQSLCRGCSCRAAAGCCRGPRRGA